MRITRFVARMAPFVAPIRAIRGTYLGDILLPVCAIHGTYPRHLWHLLRHSWHLSRHSWHLSHRCDTPQSRINTGLFALWKIRCKQYLKTVYIKRLNSFLLFPKTNINRWILKPETRSNLCVQINWHFYLIDYSLRYGRTVLLKKR